LPCHSSRPASRAEVSVPTIDVGPPLLRGDRVDAPRCPVPHDRGDRFAVLQHPPRMVGAPLVLSGHRLARRDNEGKRQRYGRKPAAQLGHRAG
jgi:hypothetical protein